MPFARGSVWFLCLSVVAAVLSGLFNFYCFERLFTSVPVAVSAVASFLIAALMYALLWRIEDDGNYMVWLLCCKISIITTVGAVFMSSAISQNAQETLRAHEIVNRHMESSLEQDRADQAGWIKHERNTHAKMMRDGERQKLAALVEGAETLEEVRNGDALMQESLAKIPGEWGGTIFLCVLTLIMALVFDLGQSHCVKTFKKMNAEDKVFKRRVERKERGDTRDTGTDPGRDSRYRDFVQALADGEVNPTVRSVKEVMECSYSTASAYLSEACGEGLLTVKINSQGGRTYGIAG